MSFLKTSEKQNMFKKSLSFPKKIVLLTALSFLSGPMTGCDSVKTFASKYLGLKKAATKKENNKDKFGEKVDATASAAPVSNPPETVPAEQVATPPNDDTAVTPPADEAAVSDGANTEPAQSAESVIDPTPTILDAPANTETKPSVPVTETERFGGRADFIDQAGDYMFVGQKKRLAIFDSQWNEKSSLTLEKNIVKVMTISQDSGNYRLFIREEDNVLEIASLAPDTGLITLEKSFQAEGPFDGAFESSQSGRKQQLVYVFQNDKIQILDVTDLTQIGSVGEIAIKGVTGVFPLENMLVVSQGKLLSLLDPKIYDVRAKISLGANHQVLGVFEKEGAKNLVIGMKPSKTFQALQVIELKKEGLGFKNPGKHIEWKQALSDLSVDSVSGLVGVVKEGVASVYDLKTFKDVEGSQVPATQVLKANLSNNRWALVSTSEMGWFKFEKTEVPNDSGATVSKVAWKDEKRKSIPGEVQAVFLFNADTAVLALGKDPQNGYRIPLYYTTTLKTNPQHLTPFAGFDAKGETPIDFKNIRLTRYGVLALDEKSQQIYLLKYDLSPAQKLPIELVGIKGFDFGSDGTNTYLFVTGTSKDNPQASRLEAYALGADFQPKKVAGLDMKEAYGLASVSGSLKVLVGCGAEGFSYAEVIPASAQMTLKGKISLDGAVKGTEVLFSPDGELAYLYYEQNGQNKLGVVSVKDDSGKLLSSLDLDGVSADQLRGTTFSSGGGRLLIPSNSGLQVFTLKENTHLSPEFVWPIGQANFADVTEGGQKVCVALGQNGVVCGLIDLAKLSAITPAVVPSAGVPQMILAKPASTTPESVPPATQTEPVVATPPESVPAVMPQPESVTPAQ